MQLLHGFLIKCMEHEKSVGKTLKFYTVEVANQRMEIEKNGTRQFLDNTLLGEKRRELTRVRFAMRMSI